jgi:hypothetical protein
MSAGLILDVQSDAPEATAAELLVAPWCGDDRPPRGAAGRIDWRMCGFVSQLIEEGRLSGEVGEHMLLATGGRLRAPRALLVGLGDRDQLSLPGLAEASSAALASSIDLQFSQLAISVDVLHGVPADRVIPTLVRALADVAETAPQPIRLNFLVDSLDRGAARDGLTRLVARGLRGLPLRLAESSGLSRTEPRALPQSSDESHVPS